MFQDTSLPIMIGNEVFDKYVIGNNYNKSSQTENRY